MDADMFTEVGEAKGTVVVEGDVWGLASLGLGAVVLVCAPMALICNIMLWQSQRVGHLPRVLLLPCVGLGFLVMLSLACYAIALGRMGRRSNAETGSSSPLATAGVMLGMASALLWTIVGLDLLLILLPML
jgi:hypothetical protein